MNPFNLIERNTENFSNYINDEIVMMNIENGQYYLFNTIGTKIWELLENGATTIDSLADQILPEFSIDRETLINDIIKFAKKGKENGLIIISEK